MPDEPYPEAPLSLVGREPFAKGGKRHCYVHPDDPDLCVKVVARADDARCHTEQRQDLEDYAALKKRGSDAVFDRIPPVEGVVQADLGAGLVMRLYRDADGRISRPLVELVKERGLTASFIGAIDELKRWQRRERLLTRDTGPHKVLAVHRGGDEWKLVIIEDWLNRRHRWLARLHRVLADRLIDRELRKFDRGVARPMRVPPPRGTDGWQVAIHSAGRRRRMRMGGPRAGMTRGCTIRQDMG